MSCSREPQVEFLGVDADEHVGPPVEDPPPQIGAQPQQARQVREDLGEPHDRELLDVVPGRAAGGLHPRARDAGELGLRKAAAQRLDERGAQLVARGFARDQCDAQWRLPVAT